jgi:hypothetical protein
MRGDETMTTNQDVNAPVIAVVGFLGVTLVFAIVVLLQVLYYQVESRQWYEKDLAERPMELGKLLEVQQAQLAEYRWVDQQSRVVAIPIRRAMELVVRELASAAKLPEKKTHSESVGGQQERGDGS